MNTKLQGWQAMEIKATYKKTERLITKIQRSKESRDYIFNLYNQDEIEFIEEFIVLFLNRRNNVIAWKQLSKGGSAGVLVDIKILFQNALLCGAHGLIVSHNHPSGEIKPSQEDIILTKRIKEAGKILDINLLDHIIISPFDETYYSFADEGDI